MKYTEEMINNAVASNFLQKKDQAMKILESYGSKPEHSEKNRVYLAAVKLSNGDLNQLQIFIDKAKLDYRDVLLLAEYEKAGEKAFEYKPIEEPYKSLIG